VGASFHLALGSSGAALMSDLKFDERKALLDQAPKECWVYQTRAKVEARVSECRRTGVCGDFGGFQPHVHALSAPVRDRTDGIIAAITVVGFAQDFQGKLRPPLVRALLAATKACSQALQGNALSRDT
jgi:DNA-binding IclR family transcriptional regulator